MRFKRFSLIALLVVSMVFTSFVAMAENVEFEDNKKLVITTAVVAGVVAGTVFLVKTIVRNSKAGSHYKKAELYAAEGKWDLAADEYALCAEIHPKYKDVQARLRDARLQAEQMLVKLGDAAKARETYEEALALYQKALYYNPVSTLASKKVEDMAQDLVAVHYRRGRTFEAQNRWAEAYKEYEKAYFYNPAYEDLTDRYMRAKAMVYGEVKLRGIAFIINRSGIQGVETPLIQALQTELIASGKDVTMVDYRKIQAIIQEQADALSASLDAALASDIGLMIGAEEMIVGEIFSISDDKRVKIDGQLQLITVGEGTVLDTIEFEYKFSKEVTMENLIIHMDELAKELVKRINKL